jgi:hypothetical protein
MVVGNGLIGSSFKKSKKLNSETIIFASGVSSSAANSDKDFKREKDLILDTLSKHSNLTFIYFSSILAGVSGNDYYNHKVDMEELIKSKSNNYIIFKVPQIIGFNGNDNNLIKYLSNGIKNNTELILFKGIDRALVDVDDIVNIVNYCNGNVMCDTVYLSHIEKLNIVDIALQISNNLDIDALITLTEGEDISNWDIANSDIIVDAISHLNIATHNYTNNIIKKYIK